MQQAWVHPSGVPIHFIASLPLISTMKQLFASTYLSINLSSSPSFSIYLDASSILANTYTNVGIGGSILGIHSPAWILLLGHLGAE